MSYGAGFGNSMPDKKRRAETMSGKPNSIKRPGMNGGMNGAAGGPSRPKAKKGKK